MESKMTNEQTELTKLDVSIFETLGPNQKQEKIYSYLATLMILPEEFKQTLPVIQEVNSKELEESATRSIQAVLKLQSDIEKYCEEFTQKAHSFHKWALAQKNEWTIELKSFVDNQSQKIKSFQDAEKIRLAKIQAELKAQAEREVEEKRKQIQLEQDKLEAEKQTLEVTQGKALEENQESLFDIASTQKEAIEQKQAFLEQEKQSVYVAIPIIETQKVSGQTRKTKKIPTVTNMKLYLEWCIKNNNFNSIIIHEPTLKKLIDGGVIPDGVTVQEVDDLSFRKGK